MAQDNFVDPARIQQIERRLQVLEDAEAIRNLKARYAALCDNQYDADGIASLFTEDADIVSDAIFCPASGMADSLVFETRADLILSISSQNIEGKPETMNHDFM